MLDDELVFGYWSYEILNGYLDTIIKIEDEIGKDGDCYSDPKKIKKLLDVAKKWRLTKSNKDKH